MPKYLLTFEKNEPVRWLGHLDILRTFERAIRRASLPVAFSGGFNPRERLAFASALSTGATGGAEIVTLELTAELDPQELVDRLNAALPPGIRISSAELIADLGSRDLLNGYDRAVYEILCDCPDGLQLAAVQAAVCELTGKQVVELVREREGRTKTVNIRPLIHALRSVGAPDREDRVVLQATVSQGEAGTGKPQEIVSALSQLAPGLKLRRVHRTRLERSAQEAAEV